MLDISMANVPSSEIELLINLWQNEQCLWGTSKTYYSNADLRKAAMSQISQNVHGLDIGKSAHCFIGIGLLTVCRALFFSHHIIRFRLPVLYRNDLWRNCMDKPGKVPSFCDFINVTNEYPQQSRAFKRAWQRGECL